MGSDTVRRLVREPRGRGRTALAEATATSRVTGRRYLEFLVSSGQVRRESRRGSAGRPEIGQVWHA